MSQLTLLEPHVNSATQIKKTAKKILTDPRVAIVELIANAWDAGATRVEITWPYNDGLEFSILDNGESMTVEEFKARWATIWYSRADNQDQAINIMHNGTPIKRIAYGKNGLGKLATLCFAEKFEVILSKNGVQNIIEVSEDENKVFRYRICSSTPTNKTETCIRSIDKKKIFNNEDETIAYISQRFALLPNITIILNGKTVSFSDVPQKCIKKVEVINVNEHPVEITAFTKEERDTTIKWSGVAWFTQGRLVGEASWEINGQKILDGRTSEGKTYSFIVKAEHLSPNEDWSNYDTSESNYKQTCDAVSEYINDFLYEKTSSSRMEKVATIKRENHSTITTLPKVSQEKVAKFIASTVDKFPNMKEVDVSNLVKILATLETTTGKYAILDKMKELSTDDWNKLDNILSEWTISMAKVVLDEIQSRLTLLKEFERLTANPETLEVRDLQPLMEKCLWMFGPEYDSIYFTSNKTIATNFQKFMGKTCTVKTSKNRPDFTILPDSTVSFYSTDAYDIDDNAENGLANLIIIELKAPKVALGEDEQNQPKKYYNEFRKINLVSPQTRVTSFVLGATAKDISLSPITQDYYTAKTMLYSTLIKRAESRLFRLREKINNAPFMHDEILHSL